MTLPAETQYYRYKITIEYLGTNYCGWQRQGDALSIQEILETAIYNFIKLNVHVYAAGRTDAGVHAFGQVAHFDLPKLLNPYRLMHSINHFCRGHQVGVVAAELVPGDFDARFSAIKRHYVYKILNRRSVNIVHKGLMTLVREELDIDSMRTAASYLIGKHDFSSFRASECQSNSPVKTLDRIQIIQNDKEIEIYFSALSFLHHMVRNIVGSLLMVGRGKWAPEHIKTVLEARNRSAAGPTAAAGGLYFLKVDY
jgi:tRNA pseudouridine38-40 synthase